MELLLFLLIIYMLIFPIIGISILFTLVKKSKYMGVSGNNLTRTVLNKGTYGEFLIFKQLEKLNGDNKLLTNIYIPKKDGSTTEIDLIMISENGIFVFESKNYSGWIFGDEKNKMWTQSLNRKNKNKFYNPIWQNQGHINALNNYLEDKYIDNIHSYIVFSERCKLKNVTVTSKGVYVVKRNMLLYELCNKCEKVFSVEEVNSIYETLKTLTLVDQATKQRHVENIKLKQNI